MDPMPLIAFLLTHIGAFACGFEVALLPKGKDATAVLMGKRGIEVLFDLKDPLDASAAELRIPLNVHVLFRGDALGLSAGEILASIQKGLEENPFKMPAAAVRAKLIVSSHTSLIPSSVDGEPRTDGMQSLDLHTSTFELTVSPLEAKLS